MKMHLLPLLWLLDLLVLTNFYNRNFKMPAVFLSLRFCYIAFWYNIWYLFTSLNSSPWLGCLEGANEPMHKFKISVVKFLNIVLGIVSFTNAIVNNYLKQGIIWSIWPCCHIYSVRCKCFLTQKSFQLHYFVKVKNMLLKVEVCLVVAAVGPPFMFLVFLLIFWARIYFIFQSTACLLSMFSLYFISVTCFQKKVSCLSS